MVKELIRFIHVIAGNLHRAWMIPLMGYYSRHPEKYSERFRYEYNKHAIRLMNHTGRIYTQAYGAKIFQKTGDMSCSPIIRENMMHLVLC